MLALASSSLSFAGASAPVMAPAMRSSAPSMMAARKRYVAPKKKVAKGPSFSGGETVADLESLAVALNPSVGFWDPLGLADRNFWDQGNSATIGFLRHAEIKHGRVAMAAFVGYCVHANHIVFPWALTGGPLSDGESIMFADISAAGGPPEQWDAVPTAAKQQILGLILILEFLGETPQPGAPHYMRGGQPGKVPSLKDNENVPHPVPFDLYDPFGWSANMDEATKERRLLMEINNGRAAMLGIFSFLCASKGLVVPGFEFIPPYEGEYMGFFADGDAGLPFVSSMLNFNLVPGA